MYLIADKLTILRGQRIIISNLSFEAGAGEALLLTGPNGAGKTTLIRTLAGFLRTESGAIRLDGGDPEREVGEQCHYVGHLTGIKSSMTVAENLTFWAEYLQGNGSSPGMRESIETALEKFALENLAAIPAGFLSAGQKRRLGLARILLAHRPVWLLDEPTVSLDAASAALLATLIKQHLASGGIAIAATHLPLGLEAPKYLRLGGGRADML